MAVRTLGDHDEAVLRGEDASKPGADHGLVVDKRDADHRWPSGLPPSGASGSEACTRQPSGVGPASRSPPSAVTRSRMPTRPYPERPGPPERAARASPVVATSRRRRPSQQVEREDRARLGRVPSRVRKRLLSDPVDGVADRRGYLTQVVADPQLDRQAGRPRMLDERRHLVRRGRGRRRAALLLTAQQRDRAAQLLHALATHGLGRPQGLLRRHRIAVQNVASARDLQHHGRKSVADGIMDIAGGATPLREESLLAELAPGGIELRCQLQLDRPRPFRRSTGRQSRAARRPR